MFFLTRNKFGILAENIVLCLYKLKLYKIIAKNWKNRIGEIDLICSKKGVLVFIEVKARSSNIDEVLLYKQRKKIKMLTLCFLSFYPSYANYFIRFDLVIVQPYKFPKIIYNAWV